MEKIVKVHFYPMYPDARKRVALWRVPRIRLFVLLEQHVGEDKYRKQMEW